MKKKKEKNRKREKEKKRYSRTKEFLRPTKTSTNSDPNSLERKDNPVLTSRSPRGAEKYLRKSKNQKPTEATGSGLKSEPQFHAHQPPTAHHVPGLKHPALIIPSSLLHESQTQLWREEIFRKSRYPSPIAPLPVGLR